MNAVTYHRVSTRDQNPRLARRELEQAVRARGWKLIERVEETGSGWRNDRPGLARVLELVARGYAGAVVVWKMDRLGRSSIDLLNNVERIKDAGAHLVSLSPSMEVKPRRDPMSTIVLTVLAVAAEMERDNISDRTRLAYAHAKERGKPWGRRGSIPPAVQERARKLWRMSGSGSGWSLAQLARVFEDKYSRAALWRVVCSKGVPQTGASRALENKGAARAARAVR